MDYFVVMLLGLCIGSFLNVCIYRLPIEESIGFPPSHCTSCGYKLKLYDLIPVLSFVILKGKCRGCKEKISFQYPIIELINGIIYLLIYLQYGVSMNTLKYMLLTSIMIVIGMIDFKTMYVMTSTTIFAGLAGSAFIIFQWVTEGKFPLDNIIGAIIGLGFIGFIFVLTLGNAMGGGDLEIAFVIGLFLGVKATIFMLFMAFIIGGIVSVYLLIKKTKGMKSQIPFGPYLAMGAIIAIFLGEKLINLYLETYLNYV